MAMGGQMENVSMAKCTLVTQIEYDRDAKVISELEILLMCMRVLCADKKQYDKYSQLIEQQRHSKQIINGDSQVNGNRPKTKITEAPEKTKAKR
jgi:hypothetical protein